MCALALLLSHVSPAAVPTSSSQKKKSATKKGVTPKTGVRPKTGGAASAKPGTRPRTTVAGRSRKSSSPRQQTPTTERYQEIQQALAAKGYFKGESNGAWGPESVDALKRFQSDQKLQPDGKIGALSLIALGLGPKHESTGELAGAPKPAAEGKP